LKDSLQSEKQVSIIAEIKRRSPSKGELASDLQAVETALTYERAGARAISVLTEEEFFAGSPEDLIEVNHEIKLPILRKDFILDEFQIWESRFIGADAILLIASILETRKLADLYSLAYGIGLEVLVEIHDEDDLEKTIDIRPQIVGINNRNLKTFTVDLKTTESLRSLIPNEAVCVSESGIRTREDIIRLQQCGVDAVLVGEELVTSSDPFKKIQQLRGMTNDKN
jgi:indole-3-glycerol phosphate synthase